MILLWLWLAFAAPAQAQVFAPDDPAPPTDAHCLAADGDVIAVLRRERAGWVTEVSTGGGPWQRVFGPARGDLGGCPSVAAAADGTAAVAGGYPAARIALRRPGGDWGAVSVLGRSEFRVALAAAPGGAVVAAWTGRSLDTLVVAPSGAVTRRALARGADVSEPRAAIAPDGTATVAWTDTAARSAEFRNGAWSAVVELDPWPIAGPRLALASAPSGRRLFAWASVDGVRAQLDGEPSVLVAEAQDVPSVAAALAEDGTAIVAYSDADNRLHAVDRAPAGTWSRPRVVAPDGDDNVRFDGTVSGPRFAVAIGPGGVPVVAWPRGSRVSAVVGRAAPAFLTPPTRNVYDAFALAGDRLVWVEPNGTVEPGPLRGARLAAAAPVDRTRPRVALSVPRRLPHTRTGHYDIPVTARCDEACDVRVELESGDHTVLRLAPGERATVRHRTHVPVARLGRYRERFRITVSDRAGNTLVRGRAVEVHVVDAPVRSFKVRSGHDFGMADAAANRAVARFVNTTIDRLARGAYRTERAFRRAYNAGLARLARRYPEVREDAMLSAIDERLYVASVRSGL